MNGTIFNICDSDFGTELATITQAVISELSFIPLNEVPIVETIEVSFGIQDIPQYPDLGWTYGPERNILYLGKNMVLEPEPPGPKLNVNFEAVFKLGHIPNSKKSGLNADELALDSTVFILTRALKSKNIHNF